MTTAAAAPERMSTLDAEFFFAEHANVPMHIGSLAVFDGPAPSREDLTRLFEAKLPRVPRYRQVVRAAPFQLLRPVWADDQEFSIRHHIRHTQVAAPGGPDQLRAVASRLFTRPLDRHRPLWEEWLIDGLDGGRWALLSKIHHCLVDGVGGNDLMTQILSGDPGESLPAVTRWQPAPPPSLAELAAGDLRDAVTRPFRRLAGAPDRLRQLTADDLRDYGHGLGQLVRDLAEPSAGSLNGPIGPRRRWAWTTVDLAAVKRTGAAHGATVNDVALAAITRAFRDLLAERGELADRTVVRSLVPVSVRGQDEAGAVTNRVSAVLANLPVGERDPVRRLRLIQHEMGDLKHDHQAATAEVFNGLVDLVLGSAPGWLALGTRAAYRTPQLLVQTVTTNVPGPRRPLYVLGRPMTALHPYVPIGNAVRISVAILSYVNTISFGVTADYDSSPDLDAFTEGIQRGLAELNGPVA